MAVLIVFLSLCAASCLIYVGASEIERRAERWERYEKWLHPPDDNGDGVSLLEDNDNAEH